MSSKNVKGINILRILACIAVFLYHLNIIKGGYLAVCIFLTLTGYLSCKSALEKKELSLKKYYASKLKRLYLPLIFTVFISIVVITNINDIAWINLKQETTSTIFGYNNFWQLSANLNYFTKSISSPFMHLWYIAIILQYYLLFPFIFKILNKLKEKTTVFIPITILGTITIASYIYFIILSKNNLMTAYYNTFARLFSLTLGMQLAFIKSEFEYIIPKKIQCLKTGYLTIYIYFLILLDFFLLISSTNNYIYIYMMLTSIISIRVIDYITLINNKKENKFDKITKQISNITYEFYLLQYPVIFIFQYINVNYKILLITIITLSASIIINKSITIKHKLIKFISLTIISLLSLYGCYIYITSKDYSKEMKALEHELAQNEEILKKNQEEFIAKQLYDETKWQDTLNSFTSKEEDLQNQIANLPIVAVGDSVMLGAIPSLKQSFQNGYFDAKISRTAWVVNEILVNLKNKGVLKGPVILHLGTNGDCEECRKTIMKTCTGLDVFWLTITNDRSIHLNDRLKKFVNNYDNASLIDWESISKGHKEYFIADGIHLTQAGKEAYQKAIYESVYEYYKNKIQLEKELLIREHEQTEAQKVTFIGNDLLVNISPYLKEEYPYSSFVIDKYFEYNTLYSKVEELKKENLLTKKIVLVLDQSIDLSKKEYEDLIKIIDDKKVYTVSLSDNSLRNSIDFSKELLSNNYLMPDKIHLTKEGNIYLYNKIKESLEILD